MKKDKKKRQEKCGKCWINKAKTGAKLFQMSKLDKNLWHICFRIIDFGLAKELGGPDKVRCGMSGTLEFMAPEVIRCTYATTATDMWSLGWGMFGANANILIFPFRVLIYMLGSGGTSPFWGGTAFKTQKKILKTKYSVKLKAFEVLSEQIKHIIKR